MKRQQQNSSLAYHPCPWVVRSLAGLALAFFAAGAALAQSPVFFSKDFEPATIGPGSVTTLTFQIGNESPVGVRGLAFEDRLPPGVFIADPANVSSDCGGTLIAEPGGSVIRLSEGSVPGDGLCRISVNVTSAVVGSHENISGELTSDSGRGGVAIATLEVTDSLPGFSKEFSPSKIGLGGRSRLTFTIDNSVNEGTRYQPAFTDHLPLGLVVADPPNASSDCGGTITAVPGSDVISLGIDFSNRAVIGAFEVCKISVDVIGTGVGLHQNVSGELTTDASEFGGQPQSSGMASANLLVTSDEILVSKRFKDDPTPPGDTVELEFQITNRSRDEFASDISLSDDLEACLPGLVAISPAQDNICGEGSRLEGTSVLKFSGGRLAPGASCTFSAVLRVPAEAKSGSYPNQTSAILADLGGRQVEGTPANDALSVLPVPRFRKEFLDDPVTPGQTVTLEFTITNTSATSDLVEIAFTDELPGELESAVELPGAGFCGPGATISFIPPNQSSAGQLVIAGASLKALDTCRFRVILRTAQGAGTGTVTNTTSALTGMIDGNMVSAAPASDDLTILAGPRLTKEFLVDPVLPGGRTTLRFTLSHSVEAPEVAKNIRFTDDLGAIIKGMVALGLPRGDVCGAGSVISGDSFIQFSGGTLKPGETCSFDVPVLIPESAPLGAIVNTTSPVLCELLDRTLSSSPASDDLLITSLSMSKRFLGDPVIPGQITRLEFTIRNQGPSPATNIVFTDNLGDTLPGLASNGELQTDICGKGSQLSGTSLLVFQGGALAGNSSCTFSVVVRVPAAADDGNYINVTSEVSAQIGENSIRIPPASAVLNVSKTLLSIEKRFLRDPVFAGELVGLEFRITNLNPEREAYNIAFTDALPSGLTGAGGTQADVCGPGSEISGKGTLSFTGGRLAGGASCTFVVPVLVPDGLAGTVVNTTSELRGEIDKLAVRGEPATAGLSVTQLPAEGIVSVSRRELRPDGSILIEWFALRGFVYCIETSTTLEPDSWTQIGPDYFGVGDEIQFIDPDPDGPRRFYQIVLKRPL